MNLLVASVNPSKLLIIFDDLNLGVVEDLYAFNQKSNIINRLELLPLSKVTAEKLDRKQEIFQYCLVMYDIDVSDDGSKKSELRQYINNNLPFFLLICDQSQAFYEFFSTDFKEIVYTNKQLVAAGSKAKSIRINNSLGTELLALPTPVFKWVNMDGVSEVHTKKATFHNILMGEVATFSEKISGEVVFTGAIVEATGEMKEHSLVQTPISLSIESNWIKNFSCQNKAICRLLEKRFFQNEYNAYLAEIGIGTNPSVKLIGGNKIYQERHQGIHLGFGGINDSQHMDLIFFDSKIFFDDKLIYDGSFNLS